MGDGIFDFSGKTALITGAASGIGAATARWLDGRGIERLVLVDIDRPGLDRLGLSCNVTPIGGDVADPALWTLLARESPSIDCAVINAGIAAGTAITDLDIAAWKKVMAVNLDGAFLGLRFAMRTMKKAGRGAIVLTASVVGLKAEPGIAAYAASKAGVIQLARVAAKEAADFGVRVNAIAPGGVDTPIWDTVPFFKDLEAKEGGREAAIAAMGSATPLGRYATADEIAGQIGFLLSEMAATITGTVLVSDGGYAI
ncbi:SDR family NAD(P)-dependent oxidoreductase [Novosphingobium sp. ZN18A2]|uniref:SDR family NAD(P)-dependent oxidoreductase n=1 Tax=Novosphingobium sp. ZN18A2 TaxID=3079861 RepID=UPI0030D25C48